MSKMDHPDTAPKFAKASAPKLTFERCRANEYRGLAASGRCYWIKRFFSGPRDWNLHACENEDADLGRPVKTGRLEEMRAEARLLEAARVEEDA